MTTQTRILLAVSVCGFVTGATGAFWGLGMPVGAVFFGLFLISKMLEKEVAGFDEEERLRLRVAIVPDWIPRPSEAPVHHRAPSAVGAH
jgi:hypothetical protein